MTCLLLVSIPTIKRYLMSYRDRSRRTPNMPRVIKLTLSEKHIRLRLVGVVVLLAVAFTALFVGIKGLFSAEPGWKVMECYAEGVSFDRDFTLNYYLGGSGNDPTAEERAVNNLYKQTMEDAYRIFSQESFEDTHNLSYLNAHLNEQVTIEPALYDALALLEEAGVRYHYLAPVYVEYNAVFLAANDGESALCDPMRNEELKDYVQHIARFANDPAMISLELLGDDQVCLRVAGEYLDFLLEYEINAVLDLNWMTNAFVCDYVADRFIQEGLTWGYLASYDGFTRNLGGCAESFRLNLFAREGLDVYRAGALEYSGEMSILSYKDYPLGDADRWHYYAYQDGGITSIYLDPADGLSKASVTDLAVYGKDTSCARLLTAAAPVVIADTFEPAPLMAAADSLGAVWCQDGTIFHTRADAKITAEEDPGYNLKLAQE